MSTPTMTPLPPPSVMHDVPCAGCGYNVRGLEVGGRCPECGHEVANSLRRWEASQRDVPSLLDSDPRWVRNISEGLIVALAAFALMVGVAFAPEWAYEWRSPQRRWTLGVVCTAWVLSVAAAWKLTKPEPVHVPSGRRLRQLLRFAALIYLAWPIVWGLAPRYDAGPEYTVPMMISLIGGSIAACVWFIYAAHLALRGRAQMMSLEARLLAFSNVILFIIAFLPDLDAADDSLSQMFRLCSIQFGATRTLEDLRQFLSSRLWPYPLTLVGTVLSLWSVVLSLRLFVLLRRCSRKAAAKE